MRVMVVSQPLRATDAEKFRRKFSDLFDGKFVFTGKYYNNGWSKQYPLFWVVRIPVNDEDTAEDHDLEVKPKDVFSVIPLMRKECAVVL